MDPTTPTPEWLAGFGAAIAGVTLILSRALPWFVSLIRGKTAAVPSTQADIESVRGVLTEISTVAEQTQTAVLSLVQHANERAPDGRHPHRCRHDGQEMRELSHSLGETREALIELRHSVEMLATRLETRAQAASTTTTLP